MKRLIKAALSRLGIVAFKRSSRVYLPDEDSYRVVASLCRRSDPVIIDGGAHRGDAVQALSRLLPGARFHCFEPDPVLHDGLVRRFADRADVRVVKAALGETAGKATFNINASRPTNSLLPSAKLLQSDLRDLLQTVQQIDVELTTIDEYCAARGVGSVDVIKLDLQGYDYKALRGARATLPGVSVVLVEVLFAEIYQGCGLFSDILRLMEQSGFSLYTLSGLHYGAGDELLWSDAIFVSGGAGGRGMPQPAISSG
jgi:FkbM family methyltransferase